jgi:hypothetical protein
MIIIKRILTLFVMWFIYHLVATGVASFLMWENIFTLWIGHYDSAGRFFYIFIYFIFMVIALDIYGE